jgi:hypothetical protein
MHAGVSFEAGTPIISSKGSVWVCMLDAAACTTKTALSQHDLHNSHAHDVVASMLASCRSNQMTK